MGNSLNECRLCNNSLPAGTNMEKRQRMIMCIPLPDAEDNRWIVHLTRQCRILSNSQCIWSNEIAKKLKNLKSKFKRESNLNQILEINKSFINIHEKNKEILCSESMGPYSSFNPIEEEQEPDDSFLSNFLEFVNLDPTNEKMDQMYRDSLVTSYENTKVPPEAFAKQQEFDKSMKEMSKKQGVSVNDGFAYYKLVTSSIRQQLKNAEENELAYLIEEFIAIYELKSLKVMSRFKRNDMSSKEFDIAKGELIHGLQQFIRVIQETIVYYYNLNDKSSKTSQCSLLTKDNLLNFVISILLNNKVIYQAVSDMESICESKLEEIYSINCELLTNLTTHDFAIPAAYCLNSKTINFFINSKSKNKENLQNRKESKKSMGKEDETNKNLKEAKKSMEKEEEETNKNLKDPKKSMEKKDETIKNFKECKNSTEKEIEESNNPLKNIEQTNDVIMNRSLTTNNNKPIHKFSVDSKKKTEKNGATHKLSEDIKKKTEQTETYKKNSNASDKTKETKNINITKAAKTESNSPEKSSIVNKKINIKSLKKFYTNIEEGTDKKDLNESVGKILEKTFYSASSYEIKNYNLRNNNFTLPQRQNSESFLSIRMNNEQSDTNNNFVSFDNSMGENNQNSNFNDFSQYHSISQIHESISFSHEVNKKILENPPVSDHNIAKQISLKEEMERGSQKSIPYETSILLIKTINSVNKPLQKLKKIVQISDSIKSHIKQFYEENMLTHPKTKQLDGDDLLAIFLYILCKANTKSLRTNLKIIENFTTTNILNSKNGYYLMIMQLCLRFLEFLNPEELKKKNDEGRKIFVMEKVKEWLREKRINKMMMMGTNKLKR